MNNHARNQIESVQALSLRQLSESGQDDFANALDCFNKKVWRSPRSAKPARYNLAILYDPDEKFPAQATRTPSTSSSKWPGK